MLAARYRLPSNLIPHFPGSKHRGQHLMVLSQPSPFPYDRVATVISKRVLPKAVHRNHLKRVLHEALRPLVDHAPHFNLVIILYTPKNAPEPQAVATDLTTIIKYLKS